NASRSFEVEANAARVTWAPRCSDLGVLMRYVVGLMMVLSQLFGLMCIVIAVRELWTTWRRRPFMRSATGIIVGVKQEPTIGSVEFESQPGYRPILRYTTETGEVRQFVSESGWTGRKSHYSRAAQLPVLYDPDGVLPPRINSWFALWGGHLLLIALGLISIGCGALIYVLFGQRVLHGE